MLKRTLLIATSLLLTTGCMPENNITQSVQAEHRLAKDIARDEHRNPVETINFIGIQPTDNVVEILPSTYYGDILTHYLAKQGQYTAALYNLSAENTKDYQKKSVAKFKDRYQRELTAINPNVQTTTFSTDANFELTEPETADVIVTFRNTHGWVKKGTLEQALTQFHKSLKPQGKLAIIQHRAPNNENHLDWAEKGYVSEELIILAATTAGFTFSKKSDVNYNTKDDKNQSVWELPPTLGGPKENKENMVAIGESDRMTLLFTK